MESIFLKVLGLGLIVGGILLIIFPYYLNQPEVYNVAQTIFSAAMCLLVGGTVTILGFCE